MSGDPGAQMSTEASNAGAASLSNADWTQLCNVMNGYIFRPFSNYSAQYLTPFVLIYLSSYSCYGTVFMLETTADDCARITQDNNDRLAPDRTDER